MIPKIIHYCWLSNDAFPEKIAMCLNSWKKYLPDYQIKLWSADSFNINDCLWVKQAFERKKYAFAADYIRLYALYHYGGIYLDSDVEVLKSFNDLLDLPYFIGLDTHQGIEAAIVGTEPHNQWIKECLNYYNNREFVFADGTMDVKTLPKIMKEIISKNHKIKLLKRIPSFYPNDEEIFVLPCKFFSPKRYDTGKIESKECTYTIHHFSMSWLPSYVRFMVAVKRLIIKLLGEELTNKLTEKFNLKEMKHKLLSR